MEFSQEEWSWLEAEWAYHCFGRTAFLSPEDFRQAKEWAEQGVPAEAIVMAMGAFFTRRSKRPRPRAFVALSHIKKDVDKAMSYRKALAKAGEATVPGLPEWDSAKNPLKADPRAKAAFEEWMMLKRGAPLPESPGYLEHLDSERKAYMSFVAIAAALLGPNLAPIEAELSSKLKSLDIQESSVVWKRAWEHHLAKDVCAAWGLAPSVG
jgi:hypothetical protein